MTTEPTRPYRVTVRGQSDRLTDEQRRRPRTPPAEVSAAPH